MLGYSLLVRLNTDCQRRRRGEAALFPGISSRPLQDERSREGRLAVHPA
jgi:hypothetical protein